jgi:Ca-activated chloride channel homolog
VRRRTIRSSILALLLGAAGFPAAGADSAASRNNEGNRLYEQKRYDEALKLYTDAQAARPAAPELHYNIGNVLFRKGEFDKAVEEYLRSQTAAEPALSEAATYNRGNALLRQGRPKEAINAYIQALRARPDDQDAKRNLELALRLMEEQKKKQQQQNQPQDGKPQDKKDGQQSPPQESQQNPQDQQQKAPPPRAGQMSEEEARRILDSLRDEEKEGIRKNIRATAQHGAQPEKDW